MPYAPKQKEQSRKRILQSAKKLFNRHGFDQVTIDQIMEGAGLTRGAFYAHFNKKEALYAEAVTLVLSDTSEERAYAMATLCVGGMVLARASGDEHISEEILNAAHAHAVGLLTGSMEPILD